MSSGEQGVEVDVEAADARPGPLAPWLLGLALGAAGFACTALRLEVPLFFNVDYLFGSIFVVAALRLGGRRAALLAAALTWAPTLWLYHHPWAFLLLAGEGAFLAAFARFRREPVPGVALYWVVVGAPAVWLAYGRVLGMPAESEAVYWSKQLVVEVLNAALVTAATSLWSMRSRRTERLPSFRTVASSLLLVLVLVPALSMLAIDTRSRVEVERSRLASLARRAAVLGHASLERWVHEHLQGVNTLARLVGDPATAGDAAMQRAVETIRAVSPRFEMVTVVDRRGVIVAMAPRPAPGEPGLGVDVSDRPFFRLLREDRRPYVADLVVSRAGRPAPILLLLSPLEGAEYRGYCAGGVSPEQLSDLLRLVAGDDGVALTAVDRLGQVVATTRLDVPIMSIRQAPTAVQLVPVARGVDQRIPDEASGVSPMQRWWTSAFVSSAPPSAALPWTVVAEAPVAPMLAALGRTASARLLAMAAFVLVIAALSHVLARSLAAQLVQLQEKTQTVHQEVLQGAPEAPWPRAHLAEVHGLMSNFRAMAGALRTSFAEQRRLNDTLEQRVGRRTRELSESEERFRSMVEATPFLILISVEGRLVYANGAAVAALGALDAGQLIGTPAGGQAGTPAAAVAPRRERLLRLDGTPLDVEVTRIRFSWGGQPAALAIAVDLTERLRAEQERERLEGLLRQSQKMEAVGRLAGGIAHDFNNMLTAILGYAEVLGASLDPASGEHGDASEIHAAATRAAALTQQLLAFSRKQVLQPRVLDLAASVDGMRRMLERLLGEDVALEIRTQPGLWPIKADPGQIGQVLLNLAVNARDAMPDGGTLAVETANLEVDAPGPAGEPAGAFVVLTVRDTGQGMDEATRARIFEPFFTTKELGQGTGLGLATVHGIVAQSGGRIQVQSEPGHGTTFELLFPRADEPPEALAPTPPPIAAAAGQAATVLVVEDAEPVRQFTCRVLRSSGLRVLAAGSAEEALDLLRVERGPIDLLLTDVVMPGMGGAALAQVVLASRPGTPVLYMSGHTDDALIRQGVHRGELRFLQKPFAAADLVRLVRLALAEPADGPAASPRPAPATAPRSGA